jgi:uncharacterized repeat protein (TIGR03803 family)
MEEEIKMKTEYSCVSASCESEHAPAYLRRNSKKNINTSASWKIACLTVAFCVATAMGTSAQTFTTLANFDTSNGSFPQWAPLSQGLNGEFYGTTAGGGLFNNGCFRSPDGNCGVIYKITSDGALTVLHEFTNGKDGSGPGPGLILGTDGNFYGSNSNGGDLSQCGIGCGAIFKITASGALTVLNEIQASNGANPNSNLVQATNGMFYGTGVNGAESGNGSIFDLTPAGAVTRLHSFNFADGWDPQNTPMIQAADFALYGETTGGGRGPCPNKCGVVFTMTLEGSYRLLHKFNGKDGGGPRGGLVEATDGNLYGVTTIGGSENQGTVFKITTAGEETVLHSFHGPDGEQPIGGLIQATDGNFYGTTSAGGDNGDGTIFKITPTGAITTLHEFTGTDGSNSESSLVQATDGSFYGNTYTGGSSNVGTVFNLNVGLAPFVKLQPARGKVGRVVDILGNNLTGATGVTFNGIAASFTVVSDTEIQATVPAGATTGTVTVTTPEGTLKSNVFRLTE